MKHTYLLSKLTFLFLFFIGINQNLQAQVSGKVFRDFNANGIQTTAAPDPIEPGLKDVTVNAYDATGTALAPVTTSSTGTYTISGGTAPYRVEFILPTSYYASNGDLSNTTVQFVAAGGTANLGVNYSKDYSKTTNPQVITSIYTNGNPSGGGTSGSSNALAKFAANANGNSATIAYPTKSSITGSTWGIAHQRSTNSTFVSAIVKRHTGLGPLGSGGIYKLDVATNTVTNFIDVNTIGVNTGFTFTNATRNLPPNIATPNADPNAFDAVGKTGIGGMDISDDEKTLWFFNLADRKLYSLAIDSDNDTSTPPTAADVKSYTTPNPNCTKGEARPWAVRYYQGKVYVGIVCTGETGGAASDLYASIYTFDLATSSFDATPIISFPLNYKKQPLGEPDNATLAGWFTWTNSFSGFQTLVANYRSRPQPILSDIEIDPSGSLTIVLMDRGGHQGGHDNFDTNGMGSYRYVSGGDILKIGKVNGSYILEKNANDGIQTSSQGANLNFGIGTLNSGNTAYTGNTGEFYWEDGLNSFGHTFPYYHHGELNIGGLTSIAGSNQMLAHVYDPMDNQVFEAGTRTYNIITGEADNNLRILKDPSTNGSFGKANGLGDLELLREAQPIEIGNRVFMDTNSDGIQDATEMGLDGVVVELWKAGAKVTDVTTTNGGEWFFTNLNAGTDYEVKIVGSSFPTGKSLTTSNVAANAKDLIDNDASLVGADAVIAYKTGSAGQNNHSLDFGFKVASCTITLKPTVSGCYQSGGASKTTVSVEVAWENASSGSISVTLGGQTRLIEPGPYTSSGGNGTIVSPQVVAFELPADASTQAINAFFGSTFTVSTCKDTKTITLPAACPPTVCDIATNQTGGTVFNDYNSDGVRNTGETSGLAGVTVKAYDCKGVLVGTATTDAFGKYAFTGLTAASYPIRVEFSGLSAKYGQGTPNGTNGRTTTQFVAASSCAVDLGVLDANDYCQSNPKVIVPMYLNGNPNDAGSINDPSILSFDYTLNSSTKTSVAKIPDVGAVWGTAYGQKDNSIYTAAVLRRHTGLTAAGLGGIFKTNLTNNTTALFVDVETLGVNLGSIGTNASRNLGAKTAASQDEEAYAKIAKVGMGDLDMSGDGNTLYFVNLFEKKLHSLSAVNPTSAPGVTIPNPGCSGGDYRPWGIKVYKGFVYVGVVCDGATGTKSDVRAYVYQYNTNTNTFNTTPVLDFPMTYPKGYPWDGNKNITGWFPWSDNINDAIAIQNAFSNSCCQNEYGDVLMYPQPLLADIEFDIDGSMVLGFADRFAFQTGNKNYAPNSAATNGLAGSKGKGYSSLVAGDILRAFSDGNTFILENDAKAGPSVGSSVGNNQGPGFGEFYNDDFFNMGLLAHAENANGGLALRPGSGETIYVAMDPENDVAASGGLRKVSNTTGLPTGAVTITTGYLQSGLFAKSASLGDVELACGTPTYLEIGNYVWEDTNKDGVQDPCEPVLPNVKVSLYKAGVKIAETTTNASGEYYFSDKNKAGVTWTGTSADTTLIPNTAYKVVFGETQYTGGKLNVNSKIYEITTIDATANNGNDQNDSDISEMAIGGGTFPSINVTTGAAGSVNHTLDAGFKVACTLIIASKNSTNVTCNGGNDGTATVEPSGNSAPVTYLWSNAETTQSISTLVAGVYTVTVTETPTCTAVASVTVTEPSAVTITCSKTDVTTAGGNNGTASVTANGGTSPYTYLWSNNATSASITGLIAATYTVTVTDANGCTKICSSTVSAPGACSLDVTSITKGVCYDNGAGQMVYDLTVNVAWANAPSGEPIIVTTDAGGSETIDATTLTSPQTVILTALPGDGLANVATAAFLATTSCIDTLKYTAPNCMAIPLPKGSISGKFWKDTNNDGLENNGELVFGGVKVELFASNASGMPTGAALQTITTTSTGLYSFTNLPQGDYVVKIDKTTIMVGMELGTKKDVGFDDTIDNDFDAALGLSNKIVLNPSSPTTKDFTNVNAAIINSATPTPCPAKICTPVKVTKL